MNPGSKEAIEAGCSCAVFDNCHGEGRKIKGQILFWINSQCSIHGDEENRKIVIGGEENEP